MAFSGEGRLADFSFLAFKQSLPVYRLSLLVRAELASKIVVAVVEPKRSGGETLNGL
jgi:hypothetical protein